VAARSALVDELAAGDLGDDRLNDRRNRLLAVLERQPDAAFPQVCADDAEVEALYRFLRNRRVTLEALLAPHVVATQRRCAALGEVLVIHDTTDMVFAGETPRAGLARLGPGRHGFWLHTALAVSADGLRAPLGVVSLMPFVRKMRPTGTRRTWHERRTDPDKESRVWGDSVTAARGRLGADVTPIHVMDRGADSYELFADLVTHGDRFVVRLAQDRSVVTDDGLAATLTVLVPPTALCTREITIARRPMGNRPQRSQRRHPAREERVATLQIAARTVELQRPQGLSAARPPSLPVHVVYVWEAAPPAGEDPIQWRLVTTEPIDTAEQVQQIVDWYRARWMVEEFFKALKTGCAYEKRQLESLSTLLVALALLAPIAWHLLLLRHVAHAAPTAAPTAVLSARQITLLRAIPAGRTVGHAATATDILLAIARLGGHLRQNGPPGWLVLGRGLQQLLVMEAGWVAAEHARRM
jgi:hypothetical protein